MNPYSMKFVPVLFMFLGSSCCYRKFFFTEKLNDGSNIHASTRVCKKNKGAEPTYFIAGRTNPKQGIHHEYFIPAKNCDTLTKKIFSRRKVKIFLLTNDPNPAYPVSEADSIIFRRMITVSKTSDSCFSKFINSATGYKLIRDL